MPLFSVSASVAMHASRLTHTQRMTFGKQAVLTFAPLPVLHQVLHASLLLPVLPIAVLSVMATGCDAALLYESMTFCISIPTFAAVQSTQKTCLRS